MKPLNIGSKIIIIAILPSLLLAITLSWYYIADQFDYISDSLKKHGGFISKQIAPSAEYAVYSGNTEFIEPLINSVVKNESVIRVQIQGRNEHDILDIHETEGKPDTGNSIFDFLLKEDQQLVFKEPIYSAQMTLDDLDDPDPSPEDSTMSNGGEIIGNVIVTLTTRYAKEEKVSHVKNGAFITLAILLLAALIIISASRIITRPIKSLTRSVRNIASGNLDTHIEQDSTDEIGTLQSCIGHMTVKLKHSQSDMEDQLSEYTHELQQTLEELEIRNAELDITRSKAIYANNAKSEFLANMSHEIRTPLSGIIGFTELLQGTELSTQQKDYSSTIQKSSKLLLEIINDILDLSKIESGKIEISSSEFKLVDIIEDIINLLSQTALEKGVELFYRIEEGVPESIHADPFRLHQIITNLVSNAIKFTDEGYVYLQVTKGELSNTETSIKFTVSDTGIGMNSLDKTKLFKAFTQADTSITRRFGGTGLGLVISRKLTTLMKGEIGFDSTEGEGSTFWFSIPVLPTAQALATSELDDTRIALICNHFIARQAFRTLFENWRCKVNDYPFDSNTSITDIEQANDITIVILSIKDIKKSSTRTLIGNYKFTNPSFLIASTRSHKILRDLQQNIFNNAASVTEKTEIIKQKLINTLNRNTKSDISDIFDKDTADSLDWSNINILVVDDNEINLRLVEIILHKHKTRVTTARSGAQAIDYAGMNNYDIIFMDLHMPGLDGYETTKKIREVTPGKQPVIIALTANAMPQEEEKVIKTGMNGIIIKPVSDAILKKIIHQWVLKEPINTSMLSPQEKIITVDHMDNHTDEDNIFSLELAKEFTGNNEELAYELFAMLRTELDGYRTSITMAVKDNDMVEMRAQVHKLHGASRCCGTIELKEISNRIENYIVKNMDFDIEKETALLLSAIQNVEEFEI